VRTASVLTRGPRLFATPADEPRARRATDAILLVAAVAGLGVASWMAIPPAGFAVAIASLLRSAPRFFDTLWETLIDLLGALAIALVVAAIVRRRWSLARDQVLAAFIALAGWLLVGRWTQGTWPSFVDSLARVQPPSSYPSGRIAVAAAIVVTASPHLSRPMRRFGRALVALATVGVVAIEAGSVFSAAAGVLLATIAAASIHLLFGSCGGRPGLDEVSMALAEMGVPAGSLSAATRQPSGLFLVHGEDEEGRQLVVKVYGRDAHDAALVSTMWRTIWLREPGAPLRLGRLQQVEHEAFATLLAGQAGLRTDTVVTAGATIDDDALLVLRRHGPLLRDDPEAGDDPGLPARLWEVVGALHRAGIAHGQLDDRSFFRDGGDAALGLVNFRGAAVSPTDQQLRSDEAQTLVTSALISGPAAAVTAAREHLGDDGLTRVLPLLQRAALTVTQRRDTKDAELDLDALRVQAATAAGSAPPELQQLRRITVGSIVRVVLPAIAVVALISAFAGLDYETLFEQLRDASWWLVAVGLLFAQTPRITQSVSTIGAAPSPLPFGPVYALQLAVSYVNLAVPSMAARVAVNIRFFQRHGVPPGSALAAGALDGAGGFIVQASLLLGLLVFTPASLDLDLDGTAGHVGRLLLVVVLLVLLAGVVVLLMERWRRRLVEWALRLGTDAWGVLRGLRSPRRLGMLFGGNLATELLFATTLGIFARALGFPIGLAELLLINISVSLLSGLLPVPGGIGVTEAGLTLGLVRAGMGEEVAFAAVILYRLATFYLPPIWGYFALRWLERNEHL
jgi:uncharacterized membrane protein YbhN (UPF0104 family)